jgi:hypothetical protein
MVTTRPSYLADWPSDDIRRALADARRTNPRGDYARALERELRRRVAAGLLPPDTLRRARLEESGHAPA